MGDSQPDWGKAKSRLIQTITEEKGNEKKTQGKDAKQTSGRPLEGLTPGCF